MMSQTDPEGAALRIWTRVCSVLVRISAIVAELTEVLLMRRCDTGSAARPVLWEERLAQSLQSCAQPLEQIAASHFGPCGRVARLAALAIGA